MTIKYSYFLTEGNYHRIVHDTIDVETFIQESLIKDLNSGDLSVPMHMQRDIIKIENVTIENIEL